MAKQQKLFHVSMIVDASVLHDITTVSAKRSFNLQIEPVIEGGGKAAKANGHDPDATARVPLRTFLMPWMAKQKEVNMRDAILFAAERGYTKGAVYTFTLTAQKEGLLKRSGPGSYTVLPTMKQAVKDSAKTASKTTRSAPQHHDVTHADYILKLIKGGTTTYKGLKASFETAGRVPRSVDGALAKLKATKMVGISGPGAYKLLAKGEEHLKAV
jgi:hypothetical protein